MMKNEFPCEKNPFERKKNFFRQNFLIPMESFWKQNEK